MTFLQALENFGLNEKYFEIKKISEFKDSKKQGIDELQTEAIEFDKTKKEGFLKEDYKSCDALIFCKNKKAKIIFIEFKQITMKPKSDIKQLLKKYKLIQKAEHSREILSHICKKKSFEFKNKNNVFDETKKVFIFSPKISNKNSVMKFDLSLFLRILEKKFYEYFQKYQHLFYDIKFLEVGKEFDKKLAKIAS